MYLRKLTVRNIRRIENMELEADTGTNILLGPNAQGKSTILEAIFFASTSKSFRTGHDKELIKNGCGSCYIECIAEREKRNPVKIEFALTRSQPKLLKINGVRKPRIADVFGEINCVAFSSEDIAVLKGEPKDRRRILNLDIAQLYPMYALQYGEYKRVLLQRNTLLREMHENPGSYTGDILDAYDLKAAQYGAFLIAKRREYTRNLFLYAEEFYKSISDCEKAGFSYQSSIKTQSQDPEDIRKAMLEQLMARRQNDIAGHTTGCGPHRDDIEVTVDSMPVRTYGSSGQQRCCALALKLAQIYLIYDITGEYPIVLLDDFMSELDKERQKTALQAAAKNCQCFISTTYVNRGTEGRIISIDNGKLIEE